MIVVAVPIKVIPSASADCAARSGIGGSSVILVLPFLQAFQR
jgi:hypothetical protein